MKLFGEILLACMFSVSQSLLEKTSEGINVKNRGIFLRTQPTSCQCGQENKLHLRIVGGEETEINQFPWIVLIMRIHYWDFKIVCGGSIITENHILTAAHCMHYDASDLLVAVGEHNVKQSDDADAKDFISVKEIIVHEHFKANKTAQNDIALIALERPIQYSVKIGPVCMSHHINEFHLVNKYLKVMGWGKHSQKGPLSDTLQVVDLRVIPLERCKTVFNGLGNGQFCTYSEEKDTCQGDSGGPLVYLDEESHRYIQVGIVSLGRGCAKSYPGVNTKVDFYLDWVKNSIKRTKLPGNLCSGS